MKNVIPFLLLILCFVISCSTDGYDDMVTSRSEIGLDRCDSIGTRSATGKYSLQFDIYHTGIMDNYHTFLVAKSPQCVIGDRDPFCFTYDDNQNIVYAADYSQYNLFNETTKIWFGEDGMLESFPYDYDFENGIGKHNMIKVGDQIAIFASKERYTNEDLKAHDGDSDYFAKVSESFECYYVTTLQAHTIIIYGMFDCDWCG